MGSEPDKLIQEKEPDIQNNNKEIYFIISTTTEENIDISDLDCLSEVKPDIIFVKSFKRGKDSFLFHQVFKLVLNIDEKNEKPIKFKLQYEDEEILYDILFDDIKENTFIYDLKFQMYNKYANNTTKKDIEQNKITNQNKFNLFFEALKENKEIDKIDILYEDTIELYKTKKSFSLLIFLFLKLYRQKNKLCPILINIFKEINDKGNTDRDRDSILDLYNFKLIYLNADKSIKEDNYDPIAFYGIIFCYLSFYDKKNFPKMIKDFSRGNEKLLYEILIIYYSHFKTHLKQNIEFYNNFVIYAINIVKDFTTFEKILNYIDNIEAFLYVINENKIEIYKTYEDLKNKPIQISSDLKLIEREYKEENKFKSKTELDNIINLIEQLMKFSKENSFLIIYLSSSFWTNIINQYNKPDFIYIEKCYNLRKLFKKYRNLINAIYKNSSCFNEINIKNEINIYNDEDEFANNLNININKLCQMKNSKFSDIEKLGIIMKYNPYYNSEDEEDEIKYKKIRKADIFDYINFNKLSEEFKPVFHYFNFEKTFKENIKEFIYKITSKITNISNFGIIFEIIDISRLDKNGKNFYINVLENKYETIIKKELMTLKERNELNKAIDIISKFIRFLFRGENNTNFLEEKIKNLDDKLQKLIYFELIKKCNDKKEKKIKNCILDIYSKKIKESDKIIEFIKILNNKDKDIFMEKLIEECKFEKNEFYSNKENDKIKLLCKLNSLKKLIINDNNGGYLLQNILDDIINYLEKFLITKKQLEEFLNIKNDGNNYYKNSAIEKLALIKIIMPSYNPIEKYEKYKKIIIEINNRIEELKYIKDSLIIFHQNIYRNEIRNIIDIIKNIETGKIRRFYLDKTQQDMFDLLKLKPLCDEVNKVKDFLFFRKVFDKSKGKDEKEIFNDALNNIKIIKNFFEEKKLEIEEIFKFEFKVEKYSEIFKNIFDNIKNEISRKEETYTDIFIKQMVEYFNIIDENKKNDFILMIKSKKYEIIIKSIKFLIEDCLNKQLPSLPKDLELSKMNLTKLKIALKDLKDKNIYEYNSINPFYKFFTAFYDKAEAVDFLLYQKRINFDELKNKLSPLNISLCINDIDNASIALIHFKQLLNKNGLEIIEYIKNLDEETINKIVSFSKHYESIFDLDTRKEKDIFEKIYIMILNAKLSFTIDYDNCYYIIKEQKEQINLEELFNLRQEIFIPCEMNKKIQIEKKDIQQIKRDKLLYFKEIIINVEEIYDRIKLMRKRGYYLTPLELNIEMKYPNVIYKIENDEKDFAFIRDYLFTITNYYEDQINKIYQNREYMRFIYEKLFQKIKWNLEKNYEISDIIRYILNKTDYNEKIEEGKKNIEHIYIIDNYKNLYREYTESIFDNINQYIFSLFSKNNLDIKKHYENMLIKDKIKNNGFYIYKCETETMEECIVYIFKEKLDTIPIAQNILFLSNETSKEEIKSFFYRAILCEYNTLFIIQIFDNISILHLEKMFKYIYEILSYKFEKFIKANKHCHNINKLNTNKYLDSYILFIYKNLQNEFEVLNELEKYINKYQIKAEYIPKDNDDFFNFENVKIFSSEKCGLGKTFKIKKIIKENKEKYYYFPLGGKLSKKIIGEKLKQILKIIKQDENNNYEFNINPSIHLDIKETKDFSIINEFFFSFFITKFYSNKDDIISIPNNIKIYVEIPNCDENYLSKISILKFFKINNLTIENLPKLELDEETRSKFKNMIGIVTNEEIEEFIKNNIGIKNYSYHQVNIFIKTFMIQFNILGKLYDSKNDDVIEFITKCCAENTNIQDNIKLYKDENDNNRNIKFIDPLILLNKIKDE